MGIFKSNARKLIDKANKAKSQLLKMRDELFKNNEAIIIESKSLQEKVSSINAVRDELDKVVKSNETVIKNVNKVLGE